MPEAEANMTIGTDRNINIRYRNTRSWVVGGLKLSNSQGLAYA